MKLATLLLAAGALLIGQQLRAEDREARHEVAVAAIKKLGGQVTVDSASPDMPTAVALTGAVSPAACLPYLKNLRNLSKCDL
jgi:hypothetical protein